MVLSTPAPTPQSQPARDDLPSSPMTSPPSLTHHRELKRAETVGDDTCGFVNGDLNTPLVCDQPYYEPCLWSPELNAVGCCGDAATTDCAWATSCVPYSQVNNGCDSACQNNYMNTICDDAWPLCATATFDGPGYYTYLSCTDTPGPTQTIALTYIGGNQTIENLPRYFSAYWNSASSAAATSISGSDSSSSDSVDGSWFNDHKAELIGGIAGFLVLVIILLAGCCCARRRRATMVVPGGRYTPAQRYARPEEYPMQYQGQTPPYETVYMVPK